MKKYKVGDLVVIHYVGIRVIEIVSEAFGNGVNYMTMNIEGKETFRHWEDMHDFNKSHYTPPKLNEEIDRLKKLLTAEKL